MLVLSRRVGQAIRIGDNVDVVVTKIGRDKITLGIEAPRHVVVLRDNAKKTEGKDHES